MAYKDLSVKERHAIIRAGVANGIHSLADIEARYNEFTSPESNPDYDMEGYIRENPNSLFSHDGHFPDKFKKPNHPTFSEESIYNSETIPGGRWMGNTYEPSDFVLNQQGGWNGFLRGFYNQEQGTGAVPTFNGGVMLPEIEVMPSPKYKKSSEAYYDPETDTVFAPDSTGEFYTHERFHARPNKEYLQKIAPYYENLNDSVLTSMGADLPFINRNGDPGQYYSPEEIGARVAASLGMLKKAGVSKIDSDFVKESRKNELKYGDNYRDLLHMYNDDIITDLLNSYANGGSIRIAPSKRGTFTAAATKHGKSVQAFASQVLAHKENYSPAMVKKANFARNFGGHWHDEGGPETDWRTQAIAEEREIIEGQKQWLQDWYAKRLPVIGKEHLQEYVDAGLGVPYKTTFESPTPSSPSIGANYHFSNDDYRNPSTIKEKGYDTGTGIYFYTYRPMGMFGFKQEKYSTPVHEFTHATQYGGSSIFNPEFTGGKNIGEFDGYLQRPDEQHARIMELRYENKLDPTKTDYTAEDIKNLKDPSGALQELRSGGMDDDAIINALNTWAQATPNRKATTPTFKGGTPSMGMPDQSLHLSSTGGPLYPFSFTKPIPSVRYDEGGAVRNWDNTLTGKLINYVENSDSIGWNPLDRTWEHPTEPGYDKNQIGMGVDKNKTPGYWEHIQYRPKTDVPFMSEEDERAIRHAAIEAANKSANARYKYAQKVMNRPDGTISRVKDAAVVSAIYNFGAGTVANGLFEDRDFMKLLFDGTDKEVVKRINQEYLKKKRRERVEKTMSYLFGK